MESLKPNTEFTANMLYGNPVLDWHTDLSVLKDISQKATTAKPINKNATFQRKQLDSYKLQTPVYFEKVPTPKPTQQPKVVIPETIFISDDEESKPQKKVVFLTPTKRNLHHLK